MDRRADRPEDPEFTFSVFQQVATRRCIDGQAIWTVMRFADEPSVRSHTRQITRLEPNDPRAASAADGGPFGAGDDGDWLSGEDPDSLS